MKEADIPLDILFNKEINQIKMMEMQGQQKPKPITFRILEDDHQDKIKSRVQGNVRFEIEGGGEVLTSFVRKNEEEFIEFLMDFNQQNEEKGSKSKEQTSQMMKSIIPQVSLRRRKSNKLQTLSSHSRLGARNGATPNYLRGASR